MLWAMDMIFRILAPDRMVGAIVVALALTCLIAAWNIAYIYLAYGGFARPVADYVLQGVCVGGPFVVLVCAVTNFQLRTIRRLSLLSRKDGLTGLNNRRTFLDLAHKRMRDQEGGVLLLLDADHFKQINDKWGHAVGDTCLIAIANRLKWNLRHQDVAGRIGGEEFAIFLAGATIEQARVIGDRIGQPITFRADDKNQHQSVTLSIGAVQLVANTSLDEHLVRADDALYLAKAQGRSRLVTWEPPPSGQGRTAA